MVPSWFATTWMVTGRPFQARGLEAPTALEGRASRHSCAPGGRGGLGAYAGLLRSGGMCCSPTSPAGREGLPTTGPEPLRGLPWGVLVPPVGSGLLCVLCGLVAEPRRPSWTASGEVWEALDKVQRPRVLQRLTRNTYLRPIEAQSSPKDLPPMCLGATSTICSSLILFPCLGFLGIPHFSPGSGPARRLPH